MWDKTGPSHDPALDPDPGLGGFHISPKGKTSPQDNSSHSQCELSAAARFNLRREALVAPGTFLETRHVLLRVKRTVGLSLLGPVQKVTCRQNRIYCTCV